MQDISPQNAASSAKTQAVSAWLSRRRLLRVSGAEAEHFLNSTITCDCSRLDKARIYPAALLSPQGKILFDFLIAAEQTGAEQSFLIDIAAPLAEPFSRRLALYKLRAKLEITALPACRIGIFAAAAALPAAPLSGSAERPQLCLRDSRFPPEAAVYRAYWPADKEMAEQPAAEQNWDRLRIAFAVPESGRDFTLNDSFPHDVNYDALGAVSFDKGCYIGQEVVSRMRHKAALRKRLLQAAAAEAALPAEGAAILLAGKPVGRLGTVCGAEGLALVRTDKIPPEASAEKAEAEGIALRFSPPPYAL